MILKITLIIFFTANLILSILWLLRDGLYEPYISAITSLAAIIALFMADAKKINNFILKQKGGKSSTNIQVGRDINIED